MCSTAIERDVNFANKDAAAGAAAAALLARAGKSQRAG
jgi:hypothetical protein